MPLNHTVGEDTRSAAAEKLIPHKIPFQSNQTAHVSQATPSLPREYISDDFPSKVSLTQGWDPTSGPLDLSKRHCPLTGPSTTNTTSPSSLSTRSKLQQESTSNAASYAQDMGSHSGIAYPSRSNEDISSAVKPPLKGQSTGSPVASQATTGTAEDATGRNEELITARPIDSESEEMPGASSSKRQATLTSLANSNIATGALTSDNLATTKGNAALPPKKRFLSTSRGQSMSPSNELNCQPGNISLSTDSSSRGYVNSAKLIPGTVITSPVVKPNTSSVMLKHSPQGIKRSPFATSTPRSSLKDSSPQAVTASRKRLPTEDLSDEHLQSGIIKLQHVYGPTKHRSPSASFEGTITLSGGVQVRIRY